VCVWLWWDGVVEGTGESRMTDVELLLVVAMALEEDAKNMPPKVGARSSICECVDEANPEWETPPDPEWSRQKKKWVLPRQRAAARPRLAVHLIGDVEHLLYRFSGGNVVAERDALWRWRDIDSPATEVGVVVDALVMAAFYRDPEEVPPYVEPVSCGK